MQEEPVDKTSTNVSRRRMLRQAAVLAGTAGAAVGGVAVASPAQAGPGDNVVMAPTNDAGVNTTGITNTKIDSPTLSLHNTGTQADPAGFTFGGAALQLAPSGDFLSPQAPVGSFGVATDGTLWTTTPGPGENFLDFVHTTQNSTIVWPVKPTRVFDTRFAAQRGRILNPAGNLDSLGRLIGGHSINIDLIDFSFSSYGVFVNLTVVQPVADGFLSIFPWAPDNGFPTTSNVNYTRTLFALSNFAMSATGHMSDGAGVLHDVVTIFCNNTTHVVMDVMGFVVPSIDNINLSAGLNVATETATKSLRNATDRKVKAPTWYKGQL